MRYASPFFPERKNCEMRKVNRQHTFSAYDTPMPPSMEESFWPRSDNSVLVQLWEKYNRNNFSGESNLEQFSLENILRIHDNLRDFWKEPTVAGRDPRKADGIFRFLLFFSLLTSAPQSRHLSEPCSLYTVRVLNVQNNIKINNATFVPSSMTSEMCRQLL